MFIDTSAIVAILNAEVGSAELESAIDRSELAMTSPVVLLEASMVLSSRLRIDPQTAEIETRAFLERSRVAICQMNDETASLAVDAFARFGKGRGHKAKLNLADCLSYACAKQHKVPLLYVGDDFAATDILAG